MRRLSNATFIVALFLPLLPGLRQALFLGFLGRQLCLADHPDVAVNYTSVFLSLLFFVTGRHWVGWLDLYPRVEELLHVNHCHFILGL